MEKATRVEEWKYIILYMVGVLSVVGIFLVMVYGMRPRVVLFVVSWVSMEQKGPVTIIVQEVVEYYSAMFNALVMKHSCGTALTVHGVCIFVRIVIM